MVTGGHDGAPRCRKGNADNSQPDLPQRQRPGYCHRFGRTFAVGEERHRPEHFVWNDQAEHYVKFGKTWGSKRGIARTDRATSFPTSSCIAGAPGSPTTSCRAAPPPTSSAAQRCGAPANGCSSCMTEGPATHRGASIRGDEELPGLRGERRDRQFRPPARVGPAGDP
jgi:hypothetical protein